MGHESFRTENGASFAQIWDDRTRFSIGKEMLRKHNHEGNRQFDVRNFLMFTVPAGFRYSPGPTLKYDSKSGVKIPVL